VTIANDATNPTIGTRAGALELRSTTGNIQSTNNVAAAKTFNWQNSDAGAGSSSVANITSDNGAIGITIGSTAAGGTGSFSYTGTNVFNVYTTGNTNLQLGAYNAFGLRVIAVASANRTVDISGSVGGNPTIGVSGGSLAITPAVVCASTVYVANGVSLPAGGSTGVGAVISAGGIGVYVGSGAPTLSAAQGSIYLRSDGGANTRIYSNNNGSTGWSAMTG